MEVLHSLRKLFYAVIPSETSFKEEIEVPFYYTEVYPLFIGLVIVEYLCLVFKGDAPRIAESLNSLSHGIISETLRVVALGGGVSMYTWMHNQYRIVDLPWNSAWTWYGTLVAVDFAFYWAHRACHEINFLWAQHQVHHSSEDFNLAVAVRHPITQSCINSAFYLPLALIIPPGQYLAHQQFNMMYQAWIHTSLVGKLGPLENILNSPSHHKVHHGCNLHALDKNYGGFLIIWDRVFGTFHSLEGSDPELVFGSVFQQKTFNPWAQMVASYQALYTSLVGKVEMKNRLCTLFYGPSWLPDAPRLGRQEDKQKWTNFTIPRPKFNVPLSSTMQVYLLLHFGIVCYAFQECILKSHNGLGQIPVTQAVLFILTTLTSIGLLSEKSPWGPALEWMRCAIVLTSYFSGKLKIDFIFGSSFPYYLIGSTIFWTFSALFPL